MNQKLIAIDLDGTTLNNQSQLSQKTIETIDHVSKAGHIVIIATGRSDLSSQNIYDHLYLQTPMINFNGSLGHIPHRDWSKEYQYTFNRNIVFNILQQRSKLGIEMIAAAGKKLFLIQQDRKMHIDFIPTNLNSTDILNTQTLKTNPANITMVVLQNQKQDVINYINDKFGEFVEVTTWSDNNSVIEIGVKGIHKAIGIDFLAKYYGIEPKNVIAFGDEHNDIEMIQYAGLGVAMANATPKLKSIADDVTSETNDNDGLANYLKKTLKLVE